MAERNQNLQNWIIEYYQARPGKFIYYRVAAEEISAEHGWNIDPNSVSTTLGRLVATSPLPLERGGARGWYGWIPSYPPDEPLDEPEEDEQLTLPEEDEEGRDLPRLRELLTEPPGWVDSEPEEPEPSASPPLGKGDVLEVSSKLEGVAVSFKATDNGYVLVDGEGRRYLAALQPL